jgi:hypothetical protein
MTESEFAFWLEHSSPTSQVIYHYGSLAADRAGNLVSKGEIIKQLPTAYSQAVDYMALAAWQAMRDHYVFLTQRRVSESKIEYLATRTSVSFPQTLAPDKLVKVGVLGKPGMPIFPADAAFMC